MNPRHAVFFLLLAGSIGCGGAAATRPEIAHDNQVVDDAEAVATVRSYFEAYDARDTGRIRQILLPGTSVVDDNGAANNTEELCQTITSTTEWTPRTRHLTPLYNYSRGDVCVLGIKDAVTFHPQGGKDEARTYTETWVLQKIDGAWRPIRSHSSLVKGTVTGLVDS